MTYRSSRFAPRSLLRLGALLALVTPLLGGCAVAMVTGAVVGVAATGVGLVVDAGMGAVKLTGKAVGAVLPGGEEE
jgi:CHASE2 domain-containing sensor protein